VAVKAAQPAHHVAGLYRTGDFLADRVASFIFGDRPA
jgi:hypothetical protein